MRSRAYHLIPPTVSYSSTLGGRRDVKFYTFIPTYSASGPATLNEGVSGTYNFSTNDPDGTYNFNTDPTGRFTPATGTFVVTSGLGTFNLSAASNQVGSDTANIDVEFKNIANDTILTTIVTSISDTSVVPTLSVGTLEVFALSASGWLYEDDGTDQGTTWREVAFDDSGWNGPAQARLGFGLDGEVTTILDTDAITYYFRKDIAIVSGALYDEYDLEFIYDDGLICWVNNQEVARIDVPSGAAFDTLATATIADGAVHTATIPASAFVEGNNVIAIEVHQINTTSSDVSMDMGLSARKNGPVVPVYAATGPVGGEIFENESDEFTLSSSEDTGTYYYSVHPTGHFVETSGSFSLTAIAVGGEGTFTLSAAPDKITEANTLVAVDFRTDSIAGTIVDTVSTTVVDVAPYSVSESAATLEEGFTDTYTFNTTQEDGTYYYTTHPTGGFVETNGSFTVTAGTGAIVLSAAPDGITEADTLYCVCFRIDSITGTIVTTISTTITDPTVDSWTSFREGESSYASTTDTYVDSENPTTSYANATIIMNDNNTGDQHGLLRFGELSGAFIDHTAVVVLSAGLDLEVIREGRGANLHNALIQWDETDTWNSNPDISIADTGYLSVSTVGVVANANNYTGPVNTVLNAQQVQDWINDPSNNYGMWIENTGNKDGQDYASSDHATVSFRPRLTLSYTE